MKKVYIISCGGFSIECDSKKDASFIQNNVEDIFSHLPESKQTNEQYNALFYWFATEMQLKINK